MVPSYSPFMLKAFLRLGGQYRWLIVPKTAGREATVQRYCIDIRKAAKVSVEDFDLAWSGRLRVAAAREKLWAALGVVPSEQGVRLLDNGGQEVISNG